MEKIKLNLLPFCLKTDVGVVVLPFSTDNVIITAGEHWSGPPLPRHTAEILDLLGGVQLVDPPLVSGVANRQTDRRRESKIFSGRKKEKEQAGGGEERYPERASEGRREGERKPMSETKRGKERRGRRECQRESSWRERLR